MFTSQPFSWYVSRGTSLPNAQKERLWELSKQYRGSASRNICNYFWTHPDPQKTLAQFLKKGSMDQEAFFAKIASFDINSKNLEANVKSLNSELNSSKPVTPLDADMNRRERTKMLDFK